MATTNDYIQVSATLKAITAKGAGTTVQLELDGFTTPEDVACLYRLCGRGVVVQIVDPEPQLDLGEV